MKQFRVKDSTFLALFDSPENYKPGVIEPLLRQFPQRRFILVGDSGERDPEINGVLARRYPHAGATRVHPGRNRRGCKGGALRSGLQGPDTGEVAVFRGPAEMRDAVR